MSACPCGSGSAYDACCGPCINGARPAETAEALMRSRYTAFTRVDVDYLLATIHSDQREAQDAGALRKWASEAEWLGLEIMHTSGGGAEDQIGVVEFIARYRKKGIRQEHHEQAEFVREKDGWVFVDGHAPDRGQVVRRSPKTGRNDPCPCNSGKKYKKCCGR